MGPRLTAGRHAIMATDTVSGKRGMIDGRDRYPGCHCMATVTFQRGLNMCRTLAGRYGVVVTTGAHTNHFIVIYCTRC